MARPSLGSGLAESAARRIEQRRRQIDEAVNAAQGTARKAVSRAEKSILRRMRDAQTTDSNN